jgi:O-antigen/teichoic acid export membrane protein
MKATSIFGGVQVVTILITLIRGKAVAVLLGPTGMGLNGLFLSGLNLVKSISSLGIAESAVRDLAVSHSSSKEQFNTTFTVFKSWIWITAILGMVISVLFAPLLSRFAFGDASQTIAFMCLSTTFIFGALTGGIYTVLRAARKVSELAKATIYGSISGLLVTLPILYVWGIDGVMPSIIAAAIAGWLVSLLFRKYVSVEQVELSLKEKFMLGKPMVSMGINMSLSVLLTTLVAFVLSAFITRTGGLEELGLYSAATSIMTGYVGMVFTAMSADYFPRLSEAIQNKEAWQKVINQQAEILILILTIVLSLMMGSVSFLIKVLLSEKFLVMTNFLLILGLSVPIKGLVWTMGFLYLSKGDSKLFLMTEVVANIIFLAFSLLGYHYFGLIGLAFAQIVGYGLSILFNALFIQNKYAFKFSSNIIKESIVAMILLVTIYFLSADQRWIIQLLKWTFIAVAVVYSMILLNQRTNLVAILISKIKK